MTPRPLAGRSLLMAALLAMAGAACADSDPTPTPSTSSDEQQRRAPEGSGVGGIPPRQSDVGDEAPDTASTP